MLNELITWVLNTYLGKYLEDFNSTQLSIALLSGQVELENVPIRKDALRSFGIPVQVIAGSIGKIKLQIPVRQFRTSPWCITIERVYGVFQAKNFSDWDDEKENQAEYEYKLGILEAKEGNWRVENGCDLENYYSSSYSTWLNYGASLATNILESLELKINDIHLRYEDTLTTSYSPFAAGIRLKSLCVQTCDANWITGAKLTTNRNVSYKLLELNDLFFYWDSLTDENTCSTLISTDLLDHMNDKCKVTDHKFIVTPINATAKFKRELSKQPIRTKERPRISCDIFVPELQLLFNVLQYTQMLECYWTLQNLIQVREFKLLRPQCSALTHPRVWWKYALHCYGCYIYNDSEKLQLIKENIRYIKLYKRLLLNPNENLTKEDRQFKYDVEKRRKLNDLITLRELTCEHIRCKGILTQNQNFNRDKGVLYHWFPNWWGWYNHTPDNGNKPSDVSDNDMYNNIEDDILNVLRDTIEYDTFSKKDAIFAHLTFTLLDGRILLTPTTKDNVDRIENDILDMELKDLLSYVEIKPKLCSYRLGISLGSVSLKDKLTPNTEFPYLIRPQAPEYCTSNKTVINDVKNVFGSKVVDSSRSSEIKEPWFQLQYEKCPPKYLCDYRLVVKSKSLDVVYNENAWKWFIMFFMKPLNKRKQLQPNILYKPETTERLKFFKNWKNMLRDVKENHLKKWSFEIDIFAPRILCASNFCEKNTSLVLIDFGRFELFKNDKPRKQEMSVPSAKTAVSTAHINDVGLNDSDDDMFMTPCSTPPGSQVSQSESPIESIKDISLVFSKSTILVDALYDDIYDKYFINLTDLQVIVCKKKEFLYACSKNSSSVHLLDKFNISLQIERRKIYTTDPEYPFLKVVANLTKMVAHVNEHKISECLKILSPIRLDIYKMLAATTSESATDETQQQHLNSLIEEEEHLSCNDISSTDENVKAKATIFQFAIGQIILEVQSNEKSIAELQVIGIKISVCKQLDDLSINMSVHGLLLVDAIQSFGPDFELLVASHRHVEIDTLSGSIKHSEPGSPKSAQSPHDKCESSEISNYFDIYFSNVQSVKHKKHQEHALIIVSIQITQYLNDNGEKEPLQIINIAFNNLDVIANQESIVELLSFGKRILDICKLLEDSDMKDCQNISNVRLTQSMSFVSQRIEISFDFHRLNILVLRSMEYEKHYIGHKVGTLTMCEAKIHATLGIEVHVTGELGGIQIVDITSGDLNHSRILSVGKDPLTDVTSEFAKDDAVNSSTTKTFKMEKQRNCLNALYFQFRYSDDSKTFITVRMASVWYTHCPRFIEEIYYCVKEFRQYFKKILKTLRHKATYMAKGFVEQISSTNLQEKQSKGKLSLDIVLSSPVLVLPRSSESSDVLVANLGKITLSNNHENIKESLITNRNTEIDSWTKDIYLIEIRHINLFSLNVAKRKELYKNTLPKANEYYSCQNDSVAILHDTALNFKCIYNAKMVKMDNYSNAECTLLVEGSVTKNLHVSLSKCQYEQLNEAFKYATELTSHRESEVHSENTGIYNVYTNDSCVPQVVTEMQRKSSKPFHRITVQFSLPALKVDLKNEYDTPLIHLTLEQFNFTSIDTFLEREINISLRSVLMEDLKCSTDSKYRNMVESLSSATDTRNKSLYKTKVSHSYPNISLITSNVNNLKASMPTNLDTNSKDGDQLEESSSFETTLPITPINTTENLVICNMLLSKPMSELESEFIKSSIDFNCLNLKISTEKWFMVFDFFGIISDEMAKTHNTRKEPVTSILDQKPSTRELLVTINSLNLILVRTETELARANVSNALLKIINESTLKSIDGHLGSISIYDLTQFGSLYHEKFSTTNEEALTFSYKISNLKEFNEEDENYPFRNRRARLFIKMSSVKYVFTKRFTMEFYLFVKELLQLQSPVMNRIKSHDTIDNQTPNTLISLEISVESPIILLPVSCSSNHLLIADLGKFTLTNKFYCASDLSSLLEKYMANEEKNKMMNEIIDLMNIDLVNINLLTGEWQREAHSSGTSPLDSNVICLGNSDVIVKFGNAIFKEKCYLKLQVLRNTESHRSHIMPDIIVKGTLSELNGLIQLKQYKLIRGFLCHNLGENIEDVYYNYRENLTESLERLNSIMKVNILQQLLSVWKTLSINFLLQNVIIYLSETQEANNTSPDTTENSKIDIKTLACINFIKSTLDIDSYNDGSLDIDLISSEILITDERKFHIAEPYNEKLKQSGNVFKKILKPSVARSAKDTVQVEVHSRMRNHATKYTIMFNNMRIMAILDYLKQLQVFLQEEPYMHSASSSKIGENRSMKQSSINVNQQQSTSCTNNIENQKYDFVLNITNSEVVFVENVEEIDTNAIILKSTTVFSYKPHDNIAPISIDINHLEVFSCILGLENESSLSILDPFTLNMELRNNCLQILLQNQLFIRVSYNDVMLFIRILRCIPKQTEHYRTAASNQMDDMAFDKIAPLIAMGFKQDECWSAMESCGFNLNEAALILSQKARPKVTQKLQTTKITNIILNANYISVCIIDDCLDADVPLLEFSTSRLIITQKLVNALPEGGSEKCFEGTLEAVIVCDYYNRYLSGWEPIIESWECASTWNYTHSITLPTRKFSINITSKQLLKMNITSSLIEVYVLVRKNWMEDFFGQNTKYSVNWKRRQPFVPYALRNLTGEPVLFKILYSQAGDVTHTTFSQHELMYNWIPVQHNETVPFDFGVQGKQRHSDSHKPNVHQILLQIHNWTLNGAISIDKVGVFFRYATLDMKYNKKARIVFDISLFGSAQKLITVRSALNIVNKTKRKFSLKLQLKNENESESTTLVVDPFDKWCVPLRFLDSLIYFKPHDSDNHIINNECSKTNSMKILANNEIGFTTKPISWTDCEMQDTVQQICSSYSLNRTVVFHLLTEIRRDNFPQRESSYLPGHTISMVPPLKLKNLLCCDIQYEITNYTQGRINASEEIELYCVNINESFSLIITLENYRMSGQITIPVGHCGIIEPKLKLIDVLNRELCLRICIQSLPGSGLEIFINAPIWIINKTGIPLIFKQEGINQLASGQFEEHEYAREVSPLMFSFSNQEGSPSLEVRLGKHYGENNPWCKGFGINKNIASINLRTEKTKNSYVVGVNIQRGKGLYGNTTFVTLSPRFQLYNRSSHSLEFTQTNDVIQREGSSSEKGITALPGSNFPFHWPNCELEPLLCVRASDIKSCYWSYAFPINETKSVYINIRNYIGEMIFLRLEVISHGGTYLLHFTDAQTLPPPLRIDNLSEVPIYFYQKHGERQWRTIVKAKSSLAYVLDNPMGAEILHIEAPDGNYTDFALNKNDNAKSITYANFIYIAFKETFSCLFSQQSENGNENIDGQQLVLSVKDKRVIITRKQSGDRSQLWLMNSSGQLEHEGSSPPREYSKSNDSSSTRLVLDVDKPPNPSEYNRLVVRPLNNQRRTTQTWRFENNRLICHANMCVQPLGGIFGLKSGCEAVLARIDCASRSVNSDGIPFEQCIVVQKFRPGSGQLEVSCKMDGPIKAILIRDVKDNMQNINLSPDPTWKETSIFNRGQTDRKFRTVPNACVVKILLPKGLGFSIVTRTPYEELAYITLDDMMLNVVSSPFIKAFDFKVGELQIDNQLLDTPCPVLLCTSKSHVDDLPKEAINLSAKMLPSLNKNAIIFEYVTLELKPCVVCLEERMILKSAYFLGCKGVSKQSEIDICQIDEAAVAENCKRYYFEMLVISSTQVRLSLLTASKLSPNLTEVKKCLGLTLIKFEDALIEFDRFCDNHRFETLDVYFKTFRTHYINQLKWHAGAILGSVDFLGNPLGFANDLSEGVSGLIFEGSVKSLVKNLTHGISNSAAKLTETLSDSLGKVVLDDHDSETRQKILEVADPSTKGHLTAGLKGLGFGLLGGITSIVRQTYIGANADGFPGFLSGFGKGVIGTVTKPIIGVLDLASEAANAVREKSRGSHRSLPERKRLPRCVTGTSGDLLPVYSYRQSKGQQYLYSINHRNFEEKLIYYEANLWNDKEAKIRLLVSTEFIRIFSTCEVMLFESHLSDVLSCHLLSTNPTSHSHSNKTQPLTYIEISTNVPKITRPRFRCQDEEIAERARRSIIYAKAVFDERELTLFS